MTLRDPVALPPPAPVASLWDRWGEKVFCRSARGGCDFARVVCGRARLSYWAWDDNIGFRIVAKATRQNREL